MTKKKVTYEQGLALAAGQAIARRNQRTRVAAREAAAKERAEHDRALAEHLHEWRNWEYSPDYTEETRACRFPGCDATETRRVRL